MFGFVGYGVGELLGFLFVCFSFFFGGGGGEFHFFLFFLHMFCLT